METITFRSNTLQNIQYAAYKKEIGYDLYCAGSLIGINISFSDVMTIKEIMERKPAVQTVNENQLAIFNQSI